MQAVWVDGQEQVMAKKHVGTVTAALQPMFSPFEKQSRKKLKICDPKNISWIAPPPQ